MGLKLEERGIGQSLANLQTLALSIAEAFLKNERIQGGRFTEASEITNPNAQPPTAISTEEPPTGTDETTTPRGGSVVGSSESSPPLVRAVDMVQCVLMHVMLCHHLPPKVYDKLAGHGPKQGNNRLMMDASGTVVRHALAAKAKATRAPEGYVYQTQSGYTSRVPRGDEGREKNSVRCYNCGGTGHRRRACPICSFCKAQSHTSKN